MANHQAEDTGEKKLILTCNFPLCFLPRDPQTEAQLLGLSYGMVRGHHQELDLPPLSKAVKNFEKSGGFWTFSMECTQWE